MGYLAQITVYILKGLTVTFGLCIVTALFSVPLGLVCALGKVSKSKLLKSILGVYTWIFRGTPLLLQLFFVYYALPIIFGFRLPRFTAAAITFILNYAAYMTEIFRAGIQSIDNGQYEAAKALGMNYRHTMGRIVIPQMFKRVLPPTCNEAITLVKDTALVQVIGLQELLRNSKEILTRDFTISPFIIAGIIYLLITSLIVLGFRKLEKKREHFN